MPVPVPPPASPLADVDAELIRRRHVRLLLGIPAHFQTRDERLEVRLVNLSQSGAQIVLPNTEEVREGVLHWLGFDTFAVAKWQTGEDVGLEFDRPLTREVLIATRVSAPEVVRDQLEGAARDFVDGKSHFGTER